MSITYYTDIPEEEQANLQEEISQQLRRMEIPGRLKGHRYLTVAIGQVVKDPGRLDYITKGLYLDIGKMFGVSGSKVERAMRTGIKRCWEKGGREELDRMAGFHVKRKPSNSDFIDLAASYFRR